MTDRPHIPAAFARARAADDADVLASFRDLFHMPRAADVVPPGTAAPAHEHAVYLVGNSLGLQPRATRAAMEQELDDWARLGVEAHFRGEHPWFSAHETVRSHLATLVGALPREVVAMNSLTTNLHLLMLSFYRPTRERPGILIEDSAFPSDSYAVQSQLDFHSRYVGFDPRAALVRLKPRPDEHTLRTADILDAIDRHAGSTALVLLGGVNYLTGQLLDINAITAFARSKDITVGWDLAHAAGNAPLALHDDGPDFAAWCSYKYLNSGPGAIAGAFVHERHLARTDLPRLHGWWGTNPATRFKMGPDFEPVASADTWQLSNPPIFALTPLRESLGVFSRATMPALRRKSLDLTALLDSLLQELNARRAAASKPPIRVLTPSDPGQRGCQFSLLLPGDARATFHRLAERAVVCDFREPNVVRAAPVPLYNTFSDVVRFAVALEETLD